MKGSQTMRIIDADELEKKMYHEAFENDASYNERNPMARWDSGLWIRYKMFENCLKNTPTIDAVEVVRCKECRHRYSSDRSKFCIGRHDDFFCADGVKQS